MRKYTLLVIGLLSILLCTSCRRETESEQAQRRIREAISSYNETVGELDRLKKEQERVQHLIDQYEKGNS